MEEILKDVPVYKQVQVAVTQELIYRVGDREFSNKKEASDYELILERLDKLEEVLKSIIVFRDAADEHDIYFINSIDKLTAILDKHCRHTGGILSMKVHTRTTFYGENGTSIASYGNGQPIDDVSLYKLLGSCCLKYVWTDGGDYSDEVSFHDIKYDLKYIKEFLISLAECGIEPLL